MTKSHAAFFAAIVVAATAAGGVGDLPADATVIVSPLTSAMWNQGRHYNLMCPTTRSGGSDGRMWAGCTAVAMAIILDYYQWPLQGTVSNRVNGLVGKCVHITNPPVDHPLCAYRADTIAAAADRALREGKLVMLVQSGDPESSKFANLSGILASNEVARAIAGGFVLVEADTATAEGRALGAAYWRGQPQVGYGSGLTAYRPEITAYVTVISPTNAAVPYACDTLPSYYMNANSRWNYFNSQYDLTNLGYDFYVKSAVSGLVSFMGQPGFVPTPLAPSFEDAVLTVSADGVRLEFSSLPGLRYTLLRGLTPESITTRLETAGASDTAVSNRVVLIDVSADRPASGAFYRVRVDVP